MKVREHYPSSLAQVYYAWLELKSRRTLYRPAGVPSQTVQRNIPKAILVCLYPSVDQTYRFAPAYLQERARAYLASQDSKFNSTAR